MPGARGQGPSRPQGRWLSEPCRGDAVTVPPALEGTLGRPQHLPPLGLREPATEGGPQSPCVWAGVWRDPAVTPEPLWQSGLQPTCPRWSRGRYVIRPPPLGPGADRPSLCCPFVTPDEAFSRLVKMTVLIRGIFFFFFKKTNMKKTFIVNKLYLLNQLS